MARRLAAGARIDAREPDQVAAARIGREGTDELPDGFASIMRPKRVCAMTGLLLTTRRPLLGRRRLHGEWRSVDVEATRGETPPGHDGPAGGAAA